MFLSKIEITNFRNLINISLTPWPKMNVLVGDNSQGKTNLLEALGMLFLVKSFRASRELEMINWDKDFLRVFGKVESLELEIILKKTGGKEIKLNNILTKALETVGVISGIYFSPTDIELLAETPAQRRRFLDVLISKINRKYLYELASYTYVLKSRNRLLFQLREGREVLKNLEIWDKQLVEHGSEIIYQRLRYIEKLAKPLSDLGKELLGYDLKFAYLTKFAESKTAEKIREFYQSLVLEQRREEVERATSLTGPHREDFKIIGFKKQPLEKEMDMGVYGSRGEIRGVIMALKLAEVKITEEERKEKAILLLDDVLGELDKRHQEQLLSLIGENQVFITTTNLDIFPDNILKNAHVWQVDKGEVGGIRR